MKCPKCQYITFDSGERCRNCGYEFSFSVDVNALDLPIQAAGDAPGALADFSLADLDVPLAQPAAAKGAPPAPPRPPAAAPGTGPFDLPLFQANDDDDRPLVTPSAVPRAPVSVRRSTTIGRPHARMPLDEPELELDMPDPAPRVSVAVGSPRGGAGGAAAADAAQAVDVATDDMAAPVMRRLMAAAVDALLLGAICVFVLYLTLSFLGLGFADVAQLPAVPLGAFLLFLVEGYFVLFTAAGGQTIGKMLGGIRVVPAEPHGPSSERVPLGHAVVRAAGYLVSFLPAGLGYLPALIGRDRRALHDRLADTRVVRA